jgi:hypothetical protein
MKPNKESNVRVETLMRKKHETRGIEAAQSYWPIASCLCLDAYRDVADLGCPV